MEEAGYLKGPNGMFAGADGTPVRFSIASSAGPKNESEAAAYVEMDDLTNGVLSLAAAGPGGPTGQILPIAPRGAD